VAVIVHPANIAMFITNLTGISSPVKRTIRHIYHVHVIEEVTGGGEPWGILTIMLVLQAHQ
jgi:hypothetical protein